MKAVVYLSILIFVIGGHSIMFWKISLFQNSNERQYVRNSFVLFQTIYLIGTLLHYYISMGLQVPEVTTYTLNLLVITLIPLFSYSVFFFLLKNNDS